MNEPSPLNAGIVLFDRFELTSVLGRGGFGIAYFGKDMVRGDQVVVKELAPSGARRDVDGLLDLGPAGDRLRHRFLDEARLLMRLNVPGVLPVRASFAELGTAYYVTEYLPKTRTLEQVIALEGRMKAEGALDIFFQLLEILEVVHAKGILHRDVKPSNILVSDQGVVTLIDFGSAREWHCDSLLTQTIQFTPGYAPPEQLSERARRGPATDLYSLCATLYEALAGEPPIPATERVAGGRYVPLGQRRPDLEPAVSRAVDRGLSLAYVERPQTVVEMRELLSAKEPEVKRSTLQMLDERLCRLNAFTFNRRACPSCNNLLVEPRPLKRGVCPVCHTGTIRRRAIHEKLCPVCKAGVVHAHHNLWPPLICPCCGLGKLLSRKRNLLSQAIASGCPSCAAKFSGLADAFTLDECPARQFEPGTTRSAQEWRLASGRSGEVRICDGCHAQFDLQSDSRLKQVSPVPTGRYRSLYAEEWARVASGLNPGAGNAECSACGADYDIEPDRLTLLGATDDPHGFAEAYQGRLLSLESVQWLAVGKDSPHPGMVCESCPTEFDIDGEYLRLIRTRHPRLARFVDQPRTREDWHRIAQGLPSISEEAAFRASVDDALRQAYREGDVGFDDRNAILWKGSAERDGQNATLTITNDELTFGGAFRKWRTPADALEGEKGVENTLELVLSGYAEPTVFYIEPVELTAHLKSGDRAIVLDAEDLAARLSSRRT
jgi:hypothetical protein